MISVGVKHDEYVFKTFRDLEIFMGERGLTKDDLDWFDENPKCAQPWGVICDRLDLEGGEEPCEVCKAQSEARP